MFGWLCEIKDLLDVSVTAGKQIAWLMIRQCYSEREAVSRSLMGCVQEMCTIDTVIIQREFLTASLQYFCVLLSEGERVSYTMWKIPSNPSSEIEYLAGIW
jgi:hypothetical protein